MQKDSRRDSRPATAPKRKQAATEPPHKAALALAALIAAAGFGSQLAQDGFLNAQLIVYTASFILFALLVYAASLIAFAAAGAVNALRRAPLTRPGALCAGLFAGAAASSLYPLARIAFSLPAAQAALAPAAAGQASVAKLLFLLLIGMVVILAVGTAIAWRCGSDLGGFRFAYLLSQDAFMQLGQGPLREAAKMAKEENAKAAKGLPWRLADAES